MAVESEEQAKSSQRQYEALVQSIDGIVWEAESDTLTFTFVSKQAERILGYPLEEWLNEPKFWSKHIHPEDRKRVVDFCADAAERKVDHKVEYRMIAANGCIVWLKDIVTVSITDDGRVFLRGIMVDITEQKKADEALQQSEARYRTMVENAPEALVVLDVEKGTFADLNENACRLFKASRETLLTMGPVDLSPTFQPDGRPSIESAMEKVGRAVAGETFRFEWTLRDLEGTDIPCEVYLTHLPSIDNVLIRGSIIDISYRTRAEDENKKLLHDLTERVKELTALHATARILQDVWSDGGLLLRELAGLLPPAFQYPEIAAARVRLGHLEAQTPGFTDAGPVLLARFNTADFLEGSIEVAYTEDRLAEAEGPFLSEERALINTVADMLRVSYDRSRAAAALRESEERYRDMVENAHDIIYSHDLQGNYLTTNKAAERILGYTQEEAVKLSMTDTVAPEYVEKAKQMIADKLQGKGETVYDIELLTKDGQRVAVEINSRLVMQNGQPVAVQGIARDVTERKRAEQNMMREKHLNDAIIDSLPGVFYLFNTKGQRLRWNSNLEKITGYTPEELATVPLFANVIDKDRDELREAFKDVYTVGHASRMAHVELKDGTRIPYYFTGRRVDIDGEPHMIGIGIDISDQKRAEDELRESQRRFSDTLTNLDMIAVMTDFEGTITFCNDYLLRLTGWDREEAIGQNWFDMFIPEDELPKVRPLLEDIPAGGSVPPHFENKIKTRTGERRLVRWTNTTLRDPDGKMVGVAGLGDDITDFKEAQDALRKSEEQLRQAQKMEAVGQLAGGIAHDFNNLLTAIIGYSQLASRRVPKDDPLRHNIDEIERAGERAAALTRQLLAFSRKQLLQPKVLDLNSIVAETQKMLGRLLGEDVDIQTVLDPATGRIKADPGQIEQVIMNLAVNARDAMPTGGRLTIETGNTNLTEDRGNGLFTIVPGPYVMLSVTDTGSGMDENIQSHIFEPFFTTKDIGKGTGLGLSTVYGIVKQSGGYIWITSAPGQGTRFDVYLPMVDEIAEDCKPAGEPENDCRGRETILLVEDAAIVRSLVVEVLEERGYNVLEAEEGQQALDLCRAFDGPIHLLLTDVIMPGMSGRELRTRLAEVCPDTKVLFMSGYTDDAIVRHGIHESDMPFLQKPFSPDALAQKVRELLDEN
jgi:PAS domain S-box-containing protein